ncbi:MAG TPA: cytochrome c [Gaiellaceae bacterium]|nr:cytochrome c [Gaiellaceae bacterium]
MTRTRLEVLQWYGLLGGALAWTAEHVLGYFVSDGGCSGRVAHAALWGSLLTGFGIAAVAAAQVAALTVYRATRGVGHDDAGPAGRLRFFAVAALVGNVLFLMLVSLDGLGSLVHLPCAQATSAPRRGAALYAADCASCHGLNGQGVPTPTRGANGVEGQGPPLRNAGALAADFYLRTGYMPLANPHDQPSRKRVVLTEPEIRSLVGFVASLGPGPAIPTPRRGNVSAGRQLFTEHCAGCHQAVAQGGYVTGARVPPLADATDRQVAEAVRIGPYVMPRFSTKAITPRELDDIVAYVDYTKHPDDRGGWAIGHLGPWPEGAVTWLLAAAALVAVCALLGRRLRA